MKGKLGQYGAGGGAMAVLLFLFDSITSIEGLTPNMELTGKLVVGGIVLGVGAYLQSRKPPEGTQPPPQPKTRG